MSAYIWNTENRKEKSWSVTVNLGDKWERFPSMRDAEKWIVLMKKTGNEDRVHVTLKDIVITAKQQIAYESCYVM